MAAWVDNVGVQDEKTGRAESGSRHARLSGFNSFDFVGIFWQSARVAYLVSAAFSASLHVFVTNYVLL